MDSGAVLNVSVTGTHFGALLDGGGWLTDAGAPVGSSLSGSSVLDTSASALNMVATGDGSASFTP